jgi:hypothetical protein
MAAVPPVLIEPDLKQPRKAGLGKEQVLKMELDDEAIEAPL